MNYQKHYDLLIDKARKRGIINCYHEKHHVIPRCMGGTNDKSNIVVLTPEEHYLAHQLLVKIYPDNRKLIYAVNMMCVGSDRRPNNKRFGWLRRKLVKIISAVNSGRDAWNKGKSMSSEQKDKLQTLWEFTHPDGSKSVVKGLHEFCKTHNLNPSAMSAVCKGKRRHHKGFTLRKLTNVTDTDNMEYIPIKRKCDVAGHNSISVIIGGVVYSSVAKCMKETGLSRERIMKIHRGEINE